MQQLTHRHRATLAGLAAFFGLSLAATPTAPGQASQLDNNFRNTFSEQGPPIGPVDPPATPNQFNSGTAFGGWVGTLIKASDGTVLAGTQEVDEGKPIEGPAGVLLLPQSDPAISANKRYLKSVRIARPMTLRQATQSLGSEIARPDRTPDDQPVADPEFYLAEPWNSVSGVENPSRQIDGTAVQKGRLYWTEHAQKVFATEPGLVTVIWRVRGSVGNAPENFFTTTVTVSGSPSKPARRIYWTEKAFNFNGPLVSVPGGRVSDVNVVYTDAFPETVPDGLDYHSQEGLGTDVNQEFRTLWFKDHAGVGAIHAFNLEGRVFVELLGDLWDVDPDRRVHLGFEIVDVVKEATKIDVNAAIGERMWAVETSRLNADLASGTAAVEQAAREVAALTPDIAAGDGSGIATNSFVYVHRSINENPDAIYAIEETSTANDVLVYWKEEGELDLLWPRHYVHYAIDWPEEFLASASESELRDLY
ncbi:MAG: hypothetical protein GY953_52645 [bacterium]|nr:hypothetical protein [bacterium]